MIWIIFNYLFRSEPIYKSNLSDVLRWCIPNFLSDTNWSQLIPDNWPSPWSLEAQGHKDEDGRSVDGEPYPWTSSSRKKWFVLRLPSYIRPPKLNRTYKIENSMKWRTWSNVISTDMFDINNNDIFQVKWCEFSVLSVNLYIIITKSRKMTQYAFNMWHSGGIRMNTQLKLLRNK